MEEQIQTLIKWIHFGIIQSLVCQIQKFQKVTDPEYIVHIGHLDSDLWTASKMYLLHVDPHKKR